MDDRNRGIYRKYFVSRVDGSSGVGEKHEHCFNFVIDVDHDPYAVAALSAYAEACYKEHPKLSEDLSKIIEKISNVNTARNLLSGIINSGESPESLWSWFQKEKSSIDNVLDVFKDEENGGKSEVCPECNGAGGFHGGPTPDSDNYITCSKCMGTGIRRK